MTADTTIRCDGPECSASWPDESTCPGLLTVVVTGDGVRHFCSWDCCMKFAAQFPPPERIEVTE
jgi:hypothetical protein